MAFISEKKTFNVTVRRGNLETLGAPWASRLYVSVRVTGVWVG